VISIANICGHMNLRGLPSVCRSKLLSSFLSLLVLSAAGLGTPLPTEDKAVTDSDGTPNPIHPPRCILLTDIISCIKDIYVPPRLCLPLSWSAVKIKSPQRRTLTCYIPVTQRPWSYTDLTHGKWIPCWIHFQLLSQTIPKVSFFFPSPGAFPLNLSRIFLLNLFLQIFVPCLSQGTEYYLVTTSISHALIAHLPSTNIINNLHVKSFNIFAANPANSNWHYLGASVDIVSQNLEYAPNIALFTGTHREFGVSSLPYPFPLAAVGHS
jgi:hypothetical protein